MYSLGLAALSLLWATTGAQAAVARRPLPPPVTAESTANFGHATFDQLIDHNNPSLGTFPQHYWWNSEWWGGEGSPVVLFTPGEEAAAQYTGYLTNRTLTGLYAKEIQGAVIVIEHRYWGNSTPYADLSTENLQYLTVGNAVADLAYFANTVDLPFDTDSSSNAQYAPWVLSGGSYSGALTAWTESTSPGTFWAYHSTSAPVEAIYDYWQYFIPVQEGMAKNCSRDVTRVVDHIDSVYEAGNEKDIQDLKDMFGLGDLEFDDFAAALENGPWLWQSNSFYTGYSSFFQFCDYVENVDPGAKDVPGPDGVGLEKALAGYAKWFKEIYFPKSCSSYGYWTDPYTTACYDTYNASNPMYTDHSTGNTMDRQWQWLLCNEPLFYWQDGAPSNVPSLVSRTVNAAYWQRQCPLFFPEVNGYTYGSAEGKTAAGVNAWTQGWDLTDTTRLMWANGYVIGSPIFQLLALGFVYNVRNIDDKILSRQFDPWREAGVSSSTRPGGPLQSRPWAPLHIIPGGFHCSDLIVENGAVNEGVQKVIDAEIAQIKSWVDEYYMEYW
ncbi:Peptidase S28 [Penicillium cinerascens]|uniref:Peptidase S28 n=1 Tax=Penicillium cinerascens TaxID=70096 RepID=A0A9W9JBF7_9EURO|nr:Peptidase S28 [Penicillium cinerascens]KAJ5191835.1 Peptidase S28 [Penicillium cinerascens]